MQKVLLVLASFFGSWLLGQTEFEQLVSSEIKEVKVFITGGEISRNAELNLKTGRNIIKFTGISTVADSKSIQFKTSKKVNIVSVSTELDYLKFSDNHPTASILNDSLKYWQAVYQNMQDELGAYQSELQLIKSNISIKGNDKNLTAEELKSMADFHRSRIMELNKTVSKYTAEMRVINQSITAISAQLQEINYKEKTHSNQIVVVVDVDNAITVETELKYIISNCGWQANYDLAAFDISGKINLKYKAKVFNNTGNDWRHVKLTLSTANPSLSASVPVLDAWFLNANTVRQSFKKGKTLIVPQNRGYSQWHQNASVPEISQNLNGYGNGKQPQTQVQFTTIEVPQLAAEFAIDRPYSIPSNSKPYLVEIESFELPANFSHKAVPKLDRDAFLMASIVGWEQLNLISGPTHVYYQDTYVGESYLNTASVDDTLMLSFGRDNNVVVDKKLSEEFSSTSTIGANRKDTYSYEIVVKNNMSTQLELDLFDQIPISQESDITVSVNEISNALLNEETGILIWNVNLNPGEQKVYKMSFTVKYPKNKNITVKKYRTISAPSF
ncbi:MAG: DUF4139 domain-containing protein [Putridiphycobacter sp.]|nr:DUF4139 domain-containing protein [Putridiphycobacter sp.]